MIDLNLDPSARDLRLFGGLWLPLFLAAVAGWLLSRGSSPAVVLAIAAGALLCSGAAWLRPALMKPLFVGLTLVGFPIGFVVSHLALAAIYYFVLTPIGLFMRLRGHDPMERGFDRAATTYWKERVPERDPRRYFQQF